MPSLPLQLETPPPPILRILKLLWAAGLLLAIIVQAGTTWRVYEFRAHADPAFASVGLEVRRQAFPDWKVRPIPSVARATGLSGDLVIERIGGREISRDTSYSEVAEMLGGPDGTPVSVRLRGAETSLDTILTRSAETRAETYGFAQRSFRIVSQGIDLLVAMLMLAVAIILRLRRFSDPMAIIFSFALLFFAMVGAWRFWAWLGVQPMQMVIDAIWLGIALFALPAFPSGRFVPPWSRWFLLAGPTAAILLAIPSLPPLAAQAIRWTLLAAVLACVVIRFRRTPPGDERQQMKWVMLAFGAGSLIYAIGEGLTYARGQGMIAVDFDGLAVIVGYSLSRLAFVIMAGGLLVSLMDYRLNDADAAIGRSAGYALITTMIGVIWALSTVWINKGITFVAGASNTALATTISTVVALLVLTPARTKVMSWSEGYFQRALVRLKALPKRIARWQHGDNPDQVASEALDAIVDGVNAVCAALIAGPESGEARILAMNHCETDEITAQLGDRRPADGSADQFPLRLQVEDNFGVVATLLLGRRSDGATYSKEERAAIKAVTEPLADALRASSRNAALGGAITELRTRLQEIEASAKGQGGEETRDLRLAT